MNDNEAFETTRGRGAHIGAIGGAEQALLICPARHVRAGGTRESDAAGGSRHGRKLGDGGQTRESLEAG